MPHFSAKGFMLAVIALCSVTIFFANAFTAGLVAFCSATWLTAISFWSPCAFARTGTIIAAIIAAQQIAVTWIFFIDSLLLSRAVTQTLRTWSERTSCFSRCMVYFDGAATCLC